MNVLKGKARSIYIEANMSAERLFQCWPITGTLFCVFCATLSCIFQIYFSAFFKFISLQQHLVWLSTMYEHTQLWNRKGTFFSGSTINYPRKRRGLIRNTIYVKHKTSFLLPMLLNIYIMYSKFSKKSSKSVCLNFFIEHLRGRCKKKPEIKTNKC